MMDKIGAKRDKIHAIAKGHKAERLWVFGSCARREERPDSDVDFLVKFGDGASLFDLGAIRAEISALLKRDVDVVDSNAMAREPYFAYAAGKDMVALWTEIDAVKNAQRLHHILESVKRIRRSVDGVSREMFFADEDKQGNVVRCLEIIGEAANHVSDEVRVANPGIPWAAIIGMRNNLIHGYNEVNYALVWATVQNDLAELETLIPAIIERLPLPTDFSRPCPPSGAT